MVFLAEHIDSIIQVFVGLLFTWTAFRRPNRLADRTRKIFRVCGPALIVIGGVLLFKPTASANWARQFTSDRVASAEFPGTVTPKESIDTMGGVTVKRTSFKYNVPGKDIALFLSSSALPENTRTMTDEQRVEATLAYLTSQGSRVVQQEKDPAGSIYRITLRQDDKKAGMQMALAYVGENVYRVVASWTDGQEDKALIDRFVKSFQISVKQP
jgi:hypothetical protein